MDIWLCGEPDGYPRTKDGVLIKPRREVWYEGKRHKVTAVRQDINADGEVRTFVKLERLGPILIPALSVNANKPEDTCSKCGRTIL